MATNEEFQGVPKCYVFKNRLQEYAQKVGKKIPVYETTSEGPSHNPSFRSTVILNNVRYDSLVGFTNRKAAEQSAAEVALMELSKSGDAARCISQPVHEIGLCKNLLQEYAQKMNYAVPLYQCQRETSSGKGQLISCHVKIGGIHYIGAAATTKKEAEKKVAKTAVLALGLSNSEPSMGSVGGSELTVHPSKRKRAKSEQTLIEPKTKRASSGKGKFRRNFLEDKPGQTGAAATTKKEAEKKVAKTAVLARGLSNSEPSMGSVGGSELTVHPSKRKRAKSEQTLIEPKRKRDSSEKGKFKRNFLEDKPGQTGAAATTKKEAEIKVVKTAVLPFKRKRAKSEQTLIEPKRKRDSSEKGKFKRTFLEDKLGQTGAAATTKKEAEIKVAKTAVLPSKRKQAKSEHILVEPKRKRGSSRKGKFKRNFLKDQLRQTEVKNVPGKWVRVNAGLSLKVSSSGKVIPRKTLVTNLAPLGLL